MQGLASTECPGAQAEFTERSPISPAAFTDQRRCGDPPCVGLKAPRGETATVQILGEQAGMVDGERSARTRVLFVTDGSPAAQAAMSEAIHLAASHQAELI